MKPRDFTAGGELSMNGTGFSLLLSEWLSLNIMDHDILHFENFASSCCTN
jgi:hypothetical protein